MAHGEMHHACEINQMKRGENQKKNDNVSMKAIFSGGAV